MTTEATAGQDRLHILVEIKMLNSADPRPPVMAAHAGQQQSSRQQQSRGRQKTWFDSKDRS